MAIRSSEGNDFYECTYSYYCIERKKSVEKKEPIQREIGEWDKGQ